MLGFNRAELAILKILNTPAKIQDWVQALPFNFETKIESCMSPRRVLREGTAHCAEGALLAAAALWVNGEPPLLLDLRSNHRDFDHVVALFKRAGRWGAISKTNHAVLRYREPVYASVRELAMSYFHEYFLDDGQKTLRAFSKPYDLRGCAWPDWAVADYDLWDLIKDLDDSPHTIIADNKTIRQYRRADSVEIAAGKIVEWHKRVKKSRVL